MSEYLSKEEIKQWRSSLEKITLEEYAKRLGKVLKEEKQTRDIIDIVLSNTKKDSISTFSSKIETSKAKNSVSSVAKKSIDMRIICKRILYLIPVKDSLCLKNL